jgi:hypothetical protein
MAAACVDFSTQAVRDANVGAGAQVVRVSGTYPSKLRTSLSITFASVATHNHFAFDRGGSLFNSTAPVVKLRAATSEEEHLGLLGLLGSSTACFWINRFATTKAAKGSTRARKRRHGNASSWQTALVSNNSL